MTDKLNYIWLRLFLAYGNLEWYSFFYKYQSVINFLKLLFRLSEIDKAMLQNTEKGGILLDNCFVFHAKFTNRSPRCVNSNGDPNIKLWRTSGTIISYHIVYRTESIMNLYWVRL